MIEIRILFRRFGRRWRDKDVDVAHDRGNGFLEIGAEALRLNVVGAAEEHAPRQ